MVHKSFKKKGQLEISFNWIFVTIIGAIILGFILSFIFSQGAANEQKVSASVAKHFETIITSTNQKIGTVKEYKLPQLTIDFTCDQSQDLYSYSVGDVKAKDTKHELIFSSPSLSGTNIFTWTEKWSVPYQVATFLYITNDREHFSFILSDTPTSNEEDIIDYFAKNISSSIINRTGDIFDNVPQASLNKQVYTYVLIENANLVHSDKFVALGIPKDRVRIIVIQPSNPNKDVFDNGKVLFLTTEDYDNFVDGDLTSEADHISNYFGRASLYATIFAGSKERYECGMSKAMNRLQLITLVQYYKILAAEPYLSSSCKSLLVGNPLISELEAAKPILELMNKTVADSDFNDAASQIPEIITRLENINNKIVVESNCPLIY